MADEAVRELLWRLGGWVEPQGSAAGDLYERTVMILEPDSSNPGGSKAGGSGGAQSGAMGGEGALG